MFLTVSPPVNSSPSMTIPEWSACVSSDDGICCHAAISSIPNKLFLTGEKWREYLKLLEYSGMKVYETIGIVLVPQDEKRILIG